MRLTNINPYQILLYLAVSLTLTTLNYIIGFFVTDYIYPYDFNTNFFLCLMIVIIVLESVGIAYITKNKLASILSTNTFLTWILVMIFAGSYGIFSTFGPNLTYYLKNPNTTLEYVWLNALFLLFSILGAMIGISLNKPKKTSKKRK